MFVTKLAAEMLRSGFQKLPKMRPRSFQDAPKSFQDEPKIVTKSAKRSSKQIGVLVTC